MTKQMREVLGAIAIGAAILLLGALAEADLMKVIGGAMLVLGLLMLGVVVIRGDKPWGKPVSRDRPGK